MGVHPIERFSLVTPVRQHSVDLRSPLETRCGIRLFLGLRHCLIYIGPFFPPWGKNGFVGFGACSQRPTRPFRQTHDLGCPNILDEHKD